MKKLNGFTLAEVLITLGIIGIVAAMTLPTIMANAKKAEASARLKKFISITNQALIFAENDYGPREDWEIGEMESSDSASDFLEKYIKPYVQNLGIEKRRLLNANMATLRFNDGSQMSVKIGACYDIYFDVNGEKKPNELGRDIYAFILCRHKEACTLENTNLQPFWCQEPDVPRPASRQELLKSCREGDHRYCSKLLEENQYDFPKDYPLHL